MKKIIVVWLLLSFSSSIFAQSVRLGKYQLTAHKVSLAEVKIEGRSAVRVVKDSTVQNVDEPTFARLVGSDFKNGTIEVKVLSKLLNNAPEFARGFIGVAYRINKDNSAYESIYIRLTNGRAEDQVRRNHSIQYYAYPNWKFDRLRKEAPEQYASYADMEINRWTAMRIEVTEGKVKLFLDNKEQPSLYVNIPKGLVAEYGAIGLWVDIGTEGFFTDLKITKID